MGRKVFVIGVGMTKFEKPGGKDWDYPDMAKEAGTNALDRRGHRLRRDRTGRGGLLLRRLHRRATRAVRDRRERRAGRQRQQQLRDGFERAVPREALHRRWPRGLHARARVREDGEGFPRHQVHGPCDADAADVRGHEREARLHPGSARTTDVRQRGSGVHGALRREGGELRSDRGEEPPAFGEQPVLAVPRHLHPRRDPRVADGARAAHQVAVLPDVGRLCRSDPRERGLRSFARARGPGRGDHRHVDEDRLPVELRLGQRHEVRRLRHDPRRGPRGLRAVRVRSRRTST